MIRDKYEFFGSIKNICACIKCFNLSKKFTFYCVQLYLKQLYSIQYCIRPSQEWENYKSILVDLCSYESLHIFPKLMCTILITSVFLLGFEQQISAGVNGFVLLELSLYKHVLERVKFPQISPTDNDIRMNISTNATVDTVMKLFWLQHENTYYF